MSKLYNLVFFLSLTTILQAQVHQDQYTNVIIPDTTIIDVNNDGFKFIYHTVKEDESLYGIASSYHIPLWGLNKFNKGLDATTLKIGDDIKIPVIENRFYHSISNLSALDSLRKVYYKVKKGDTLYGIAKRTFGIDINILKAYNFLESNEISTDQLLHVAFVPKRGQEVEFAFDHVYDPINEDDLLESEFVSKGAKKAKLMEERGAARWKPDQGDGPTLFALHRTAKRGSIIKITNPDTGVSIHTRVLGKIPPTQYQKHIKVVVSAKVADLIGGINKEFFVTLQYYK